MGFLDFLFKKNYDSEDIVDPVHDYAYYKEADPLPRQYSDKGISKFKNNKTNPWRAYLNIGKRVKGDNGKSSPVYIHIGSYPTKEEAQKARWEFIENLK